MARNIMQSSGTSDNTAKDLFKCLGITSFNISSRRNWGTPLEKKLAKLPFAQLREAFAKAAEVIESSDGNDAVPHRVKNARRFKTESANLVESCSADAVYSRMRSEKGTGGTWGTADKAIKRFGPLLASTVMARLWALSGQLSSAADQVLNAAVINAITEVCLLAETARHIFYTEERTRQCQQLARSCRTPASARNSSECVKKIEAKLSPSLVEDYRWLKENGPRFTSSTEACIAYLESHLHTCWPMPFLHLADLYVESAQASIQSSMAGQGPAVERSAGTRVSKQLRG